MPLGFLLRREQSELLMTASISLGLIVLFAVFLMDLSLVSGIYQVFQKRPNDSFVLVNVSHYFPFFIYDFVNWIFSLPACFFGERFDYPVDFLKEQLLISLSLCVVFFISN